MSNAWWETPLWNTWMLVNTTVQARTASLSTYATHSKKTSIFRGKVRLSNGFIGHLNDYLLLKIPHASKNALNDGNNQNVISSSVTNIQRRLHETHDPASLHILSRQQNPKVLFTDAMNKIAINAQINSPRAQCQLGQERTINIGLVYDPFSYYLPLQLLSKTSTWRLPPFHVSNRFAATSLNRVS